jgi:hypothetical protein
MPGAATPRPPLPASLAAAAAAIVAALAVAGLPLDHALRSSVSSVASTLVLILAFAAIGLVVARRQPGNAVGWVFLAAAFSLAIGIDAGAYSELVYRHHRGWPLGPVAVLLQLGWAPAILLMPLAVLLFPDGRRPPGAWVALLWGYLTVGAAYLAGLAAVAMQAVLDDRIRVNPGGDLAVVDNPTGQAAWFGTVEAIVLPVLVAAWVAFIARQVLAYRGATGRRRAQLKWLMAGAVVCGACGGFIFVGASLDSHPSRLATTAVSVASLGVLALPASIAVAILRYRLYEIDVIIRRTLVYTILVGSLTVVYLAGIAVTERALQAVAGTSSTLAVSISTLAVAVLFQPFRTRIQRGIDRRFSRRRYDAAQALDGFSARLRSQVDLTALRAEVLAVIGVTVEPSHADLWLRAAPEAPEGAARTVSRPADGR